MLSQFISSLSHLDYVVLVVNLVTIILSPYIAGLFPKDDDDAVNKRRVWSLRIINISLISIYVVAGFLGISVGIEIAQTGLTLLIGFVVLYVVRGWLLSQYGRTRVLFDETEVHSQTYQSEIFGLIASIFVIVSTFLVIINIWDLNQLLQATSVLGALAIIIFATKDVWAPDNIGSLIMLYHGEVVTGAVVKVDEMNLLGITLKTNLTQTVFRDLVHGHRIIIRNSLLRNCRLDVLTKNGPRGLDQYIDFKIGYEHKCSDVVEFLTGVWKNAACQEKSINEAREPTIVVAENGDHAVTWRLYYSVQIVYKLNAAKFAIQRAALEASQAEGVGLNTPVTHVINHGASPTASEIAT